MVSQPLQQPHINNTYHNSIDFMIILIEDAKNRYTKGIIFPDISQVFPGLCSTCIESKKKHLRIVALV